MINPISFSNGITRTPARLVVHRDTMNPKAFVLSWDFGDGTAIGTEGECSRKYFAREYQARRYGREVYGERVYRANW